MRLAGSPEPAAAGTFSLARGILTLAAVMALVVALYALGGWRVRAYVSGSSDLGAYFLPKYQYAAERIAEGGLPLWNPYEFAGIPFLPTIQPAVFYPPLRVIYAFFSGERAYGLFFVFHVALGALGTLLLMRRLGAGLCPAVLASLWVLQPTWLVRVYDHPVYVGPAAWIPFLILLVREAIHAPRLRLAGLLALAAAMQAWIGYPPMVLATVYLLVLGVPFWLIEVRKRIDARRLAGSIAVLALGALAAGLLLAGQILPTLELAATTDRADEATMAGELMAELATKGPESFFLIGVPQMTFRGALVELWSRYGPVLLALALAGLVIDRRRPAVWFAACGVWLAALLPFGAYKWLPFYGLVRFALEWDFVAPLLVYLLAGLGLDAVLRGRVESRRIRVAATVILAVLAIAWNARRIDPLWLTQTTLAEAPPVPPWIEEVCRFDETPYRTFWPEGQLRGSLMRNGLRSISGYEQSLLPSRTARLSRALEIGNGGVWPTWAKETAIRRNVVSRLGLRCVLTPWAPILARAGFLELRAPGFGPWLYVNPEALPRARFAYEASFASSPDQALDLLLSGRAAPVILEGEPESDLRGCVDAAEARALIVLDEPEEVRVSVDTPCPGYLVLADTHAPGWSATVDGEPAEIRVADYAFRAVRVPAGKHEVIFRYTLPGLRLGLFLSAAGVLLVALLVIKPPRA